MGLEEMRDKVAIVGVGYTPQGRVPGRSNLSFHVEAARNAIEHAGLTNRDIDGVIIQPSVGDHNFTSWEVASHLGITPRFTAIEDTWGATAGCMVHHAAWALQAGFANYIVCSYGENSRSGPINVYHGGSGDNPVFGFFGDASGYAMAARRAIHEYGTGPRVWSHIATSQRKWANLNPRAMMHGRTMNLEDYYNSRWVVEPFRLFDCCLVTDGGRAFVMTTADRAKDLKNPVVLVAGMGQGFPSKDIVYSTTMTGPTGAKISGEAAFKMAGITPKDVDVAEIYDCFTYTVEISMIDYGFFKKGEGEEFFANGRTAPGGEFPVNTSGGLLSEVYFMGFTPLTEGVVQLMGQAGERQIKDPKIVLTSGNGGVLQTHVTNILRRADL